MTSLLRQSALDHGWDSDVVSGLSVDHSDDKFSVKVHSSVADRAFVHEYGSEQKRPTAAIRKFLNDSSFAEKAFIKRLDHHYGKESR
jgi:hypothetical protein